MTSLALPPSTNGYGRVEHPVSGILLNRIDDGRPISPFRPRGGSDDRGMPSQTQELKVNLVVPAGEEQPPAPAQQPVHPTLVLPPATPNRAHSPQPPSAGVTAPGVNSPRIRFAPLPEPRPRSLSTGQDLPAGEGAEGERVVPVGTQNVDYDDTFYTTDENDDSGSDSDASIDWSKWMTLGMSNGWGKKKSRKGRPSSFTSSIHSDKGEDTESQEGFFGQPLKKSISTGGLIGSSPFRFGPELERKKQMTGGSSSSAGAMFMGRRGSADKGDQSGHRRGSASVDLKPVRMINGRVYGARRASEAAADEAARRRRMEPAFVEWGSSHKNYGTPSVAKSVDDDDGGGMAWVKRRREERERKAREAKEAEEAAAAAAATHGGGSASHHDVGPKGERLTTDSLPPHLDMSGPGSMSSASSSASDAQPALSPTTPMERPGELPHGNPQHPNHVEMLNKPDSIKHADAHDGDHHVVYAVNVPQRHGSESSYQSQATTNSSQDDHEEDEEDDEYADDDDEEDVPIDDRCTRAAGVEVMAKHRVGAQG